MQQALLRPAPRLCQRLLSSRSLCPRLAQPRTRQVLNQQQQASSMATVSAPAVDASSSNPLLADWNKTEPFGLPPFASITAAHFRPALDIALAAHLDEIKRIATQQEAPTFDNTAVALDRCGELSEQVNNVFSNLCLSSTSPELQAVELEMAPVLAAHSSKVYSFPGLFPRIEALHAAKDTSGLEPEQVRLVERLYLDFVRAGARFDAQAQQRHTQIVERLAELETSFAQNLLADESSFTIELGEEDLAGCPPSLVAAARQAAAERSLPSDRYVITLSRSLVEPFLTTAHRRDLRERAWRAWTQRGELDPARDNLAVAKEILVLRAEQAALHGFPSFAAYQTDDTMARTPARVMQLLEEVWGKAKLSADKERQALEAYVRSSAAAGDAELSIQPWDWRYYAEKVRQERYDLDDALIKPYFSLDAMTQAMFDVAGRLFGLRFVLRPDVAGYHPDVKVYEVREAGEGGRLAAVFLADNYSRPNKRGGAWMSELRNALPCAGRVPIILNNNNFSRPAPGEPTLLSFDDVRTLFHEFGHGCHGMLSDTRFLRLAGTSVMRDWVELPSQLMEHWMQEPAVLKQHARHYQTQEPIPDHLLAKLKAASSFNQGFATIEYTACALVDQALHQLPADQLPGLSISAFEAQELQRLGMPQGIVMRHRPAHFLHLFSSSAYAAGYYVYLWAEVLDADGFEAFLEAGSCFDTDTAARARRFIYSSGNSVEPGAAFRAFRGRDPVIEPMLRKKGMLVGAAAS